MKISTIATIVLSSAVIAHAADDLASAFKEGKLDGRLRMHYIATDWDDNTAGGKNGPDAHGLAAG